MHEIEETLSVNRYEDPSCVAVFYLILSHVSSLKNLSLDRNNEEMTCDPRGIFLVMVAMISCSVVKLSNVICFATLIYHSRFVRRQD